MLRELRTVELFICWQNKRHNILKQGESGIVLNLDSSPPNLKEAFLKLAMLIEKPHFTPDEIRETIQQLDNRIIMRELLRDGLKLTMRNCNQERI